MTSWCSSTSRGPSTPRRWRPSPPASPRASPHTREVSRLHPNPPGSPKTPPCPVAGEPLKFRHPPCPRLRHPGAEDHPNRCGAGGLPGHPKFRSQGGGVDLHPGMWQHRFPWQSGEDPPPAPAPSIAGIGMGDAQRRVPLLLGTQGPFVHLSAMAAAYLGKMRTSVTRDYEVGVPPSKKSGGSIPPPQLGGFYFIPTKKLALWLNPLPAEQVQAE